MLTATKFFTSFFTCQFLIHAAIGQDSSLQKRPTQIYISTAALYDFPQSFGATAGIGFPFKHITTYKEKNGVAFTHNKERIVEGDLGFYRYPFNHTGLLLNAFIGTKQLYKNGCFFKNLLGAGLLRTVYDGKVYAVDDGGNIKTKNFYGRTSATINFALAYGFDGLYLKKPKPVTIAVEPMFWLQFPYNSFVLPHGSFLCIVTYALPHTNLFVKQKTIHKNHQA